MHDRKIPIQAKQYLSKIDKAKMKILPPKADILPLIYFMLLIMACHAAVLWSPIWIRAAYGAWIAVGVAYLVHDGIEPGLPMTFIGNVRRIAKAHIWPLYSKKMNLNGCKPDQGK
jgi:hypothetical protein